MSGRNLTITFVVQITEYEQGEDIIRRARAAWLESGNPDAEVWENNPYTPPMGPWD